jgi:hypothetical protein
VNENLLLTVIRLIRFETVSDEQCISYLLELEILPKLISVIDLGVEEISYEALWVMVNMSIDTNAVNAMHKLELDYKLVNLLKVSIDSIKEMVIFNINIVCLDIRQHDN